MTGDAIDAKTVAPEQQQPAHGDAHARWQKAKVKLSQSAAQQAGGPFLPNLPFTLPDKFLTRCYQK
jgi:hypothetical protein